MRKNNVKKILGEGGSITNGWLHIPNTWSAEVMASAGWDAVTVDMQHGLMDMETAIQMLQAISTTDTMPLARAGWNKPGEIMRLLDGGAYGIICPMINTREECEAFVGACKYPPQGYRSVGPTRAKVYGGSDYVDHANDELLTLAMIETVQALENIEAILSVEGLDGIFAGSGDLRLSLIAQFGHNEIQKYFESSLEKVMSACERANKTPGIWSPNIDAAEDAIKKGFRFLSISSDSMILSAQSKQLAETMKSKLKN
ncbi:MAG: aldolase/citrate lyase family protein [Bacteroidota bacterium]